MLFTPFALLPLVSAAPLIERQAQGGETGSNIVAGSYRNPDDTKCLAVRGGPNVTLADGVPVEMYAPSLL